MLPTALSDADKSLDSNLTPHSWVNRVSDNILAEIILGYIQPLSSLTVVIIRLQILRWGKNSAPWVVPSLLAVLSSSYPPLSLKEEPPHLG